MTDETKPNEVDIEPEEPSEKNDSEQKIEELKLEENEEKELTIEEKFEQLEEKLAKSESEIGYRDAEIINIRKKMSGEKSSLIRYAGFNLSRRIKIQQIHGCN